MSKRKIEDARLAYKLMGKMLIEREEWQMQKERGRSIIHTDGYFSLVISVVLKISIKG
jgi:hypothetical protein